MPHTYVCCDCHLVFSTKERQPVLNPEIRTRLFDYAGGLAKKHGFGLITAGGVEDHIHLLISLPATMSISQAIKLIKGATSRWIHRTFVGMEDFAWQEGYGAFSVSRSHRQKSKTYITNQVRHHQSVSFEEEWNLFLKTHDLLTSTSVDRM